MTVAPGIVGQLVVSWCVVAWVPSTSRYHITCRCVAHVFVHLLSYSPPPPLSLVCPARVVGTRPCVMVMRCSPGWVVGIVMTGVWLLQMHAHGARMASLSHCHHSDRSRCIASHCLTRPGVDLPASVFVLSVLPGCHFVVSGRCCFFSVCPWKNPLCHKPQATDLSSCNLQPPTSSSRPSCLLKTGLDDCLAVGMAHCSRQRPHCKCDSSCFHREGGALAARTLSAFQPPAVTHPPPHRTH